MKFPEKAKTIPHMTIKTRPDLFELNKGILVMFENAGYTLSNKPSAYHCESIDVDGERKWVTINNTKSCHENDPGRLIAHSYRNWNLIYSYIKASMLPPDGYCKVTGGPNPNQRKYIRVKEYLFNVHNDSLHIGKIKAASHEYYSVEYLEYDPRMTENVERDVANAIRDFGFNETVKFNEGSCCSPYYCTAPFKDVCRSYEKNEPGKPFTIIDIIPNELDPECGHVVFILKPSYKATKIYVPIRWKDSELCVVNLTKYSELKLGNSAVTLEWDTEAKDVMVRIGSHKYYRQSICDLYNRYHDFATFSMNGTTVSEIVNEDAGRETFASFHGYDSAAKRDKMVTESWIYFSNGMSGSVSEILKIMEKAYEIYEANFSREPKKPLFY